MRPGNQEVEPPTTVDESLRAGLAGLGLTFADGTEERLLAYLQLLAKWNRVYNLTAIREPARMVTHHLLDSLAVLPHVHGTSVLDVGSGAGLPGMVFAIAKAELRCTLLDSNGKKTRFLTQAAIELGLRNVEAVQGRIEDFRPRQPFDTIVSRAFADVAMFTAVAAPLLAQGGRLLAMKARRANEEMRGMPAGWSVTTESLEVPHLDAVRVLVIAERIEIPSPVHGE